MIGPFARPTLLVFTTLFFIATTAGQTEADSVSLGAAGDFAVLGLGSGGKIDLSNPQTTIQGNLGLGPNGQQNFSDGFITSNYVVDPTANDAHNRRNVQIGGSVIPRDLTPAVRDAVAASNLIAGLTPTQTFQNITNSMAIAGNGGTNVINVAGKIKLDGSATLTLTGGAGEFFYFNVHSFGLTGTTAIHLSGGVQASHIIFNVLGTGDQVAFTGKSLGVGTFLAIDRDISVTGATVDGALIGGRNHNIALVSGSQVNEIPFAPVPEPASALLLGLGGLGLAVGAVRARWR